MNVYDFGSLKRAPLVHAFGFLSLYSALNTFLGGPDLASATREGSKGCHFSVFPFMYSIVPLNTGLYGTIPDSLGNCVNMKEM